MNSDDDFEDLPGVDNAVTAGRGPWCPWRFVGLYVVAPNKVNKGTLLRVAQHRSEAREMVFRQVVAVLEASKAINRMMGKPEYDGMLDKKRGES